MDYATLKIIHVTSVVLSFALFAIRGGEIFSGKATFSGKTMRVLPHVVNTVLLLSALWMVFIAKNYPFMNVWPTVKLLGFVAYAVLSVFAFRGRRGSQALFFVLAAVVFIFTASVGLTHNSLGFLSLFFGSGDA